MREIIYGVDFKRYQEMDGLNHSLLRYLFPPNEPIDFLYASQYPRKPSDSQNFGSAVHIAVFEHEKFDDSIVIAPQTDRRTKAGKDEYQEFLTKADGKIILTQEELDACFYIIDACQKHPVLTPLLNHRQSTYETSGFFVYKDVQLKMRLDYLNPELSLIMDLKTTKAAHPRSFAHSVLDFCYHSQAAFYLLGMQEITGEVWADFLWIALQSTPPYKIYLYQPDTTWFQHGMKLIDNALDLYKECLAKNCFPGVSPEVKVLNAPHFLQGDLL